MPLLDKDGIIQAQNSILSTMSGRWITETKTPPLFSRGILHRPAVGGMMQMRENTEESGFVSSTEWQRKEIEVKIAGHMAVIMSSSELAQDELTRGETG